MSSSQSATLCDRFVACLLGGALGDALGYPIEFERSVERIPKFEAGGPRDLFALGQGLVSDDTQMALFSAEALIRAKSAAADDPTPFALGAYQRWLSTQAMTAGKPIQPRVGQGCLLMDARMFVRRAPGQTCLGALAASHMKSELPSVSTPPNDSKGCGAVMRAAPFGLAATSRETAFENSRDAAVLTHGHPSGYLSAAYLSALIFDVARGVELPRAMLAADALLAREANHEELAGRLAAARLAPHDASSAELVALLGEGWVGEEALALGLACALAADRDHVAGALWRAVAHVGDSDSTGSIAGNLLGARFGTQALPRSWLAQLELADVLETVARELYAVTQEGKHADATRYPAITGCVGVP